MRRYLRPALLMLAVATLSSFAPGQTILSPRRSHVPIPGGGLTPEAADEFLKGRMQSAQSAGELEKLARDILANPEKYNLTEEERNRLRSGRMGPVGSQLQSRLEKIIDQQTGQQFDPEKAQRLKEYLDQFKERSSNPDRRHEDGGGRSFPPDPQGNLPPDGGPIPSPNRREPTGSSTPPPPRLEPPQPSAGDDALARGLRRLGDRLSETPLADSPTFRRMLLRLDRLPQDSPRSSVDWSRHRDQIGRQLATLGNRLAKDVSWPDIKWTRRELPLPRRPSGNFSPPSLPEFSAPRGGDDGFSGLLILICLGVAVVVVWTLVRRRGPLGLLSRSREPSLGPWPVRPEAVRTREDLVLAFDYLSLLLLGKPARVWGHCAIAASLGTDPARGDAAERLASLYERARYAPPEEELPESELSTAQRDLKYLAGAAAA